MEQKNEKKAPKESNINQPAMNTYKTSNFNNSSVLSYQEPVAHKTMNSSVPIPSKQASDTEEVQAQVEISQDVEVKKENRNTSAEPSLQIRNKIDHTKITAKEI